MFRAVSHRRASYRNSAHDSVTSALALLAIGIVSDKKGQLNHLFDVAANPVEDWSKAKFVPLH